MIVIDKTRMFEVIKQRRPRSIAISGPEGVISQLQNHAESITKEFDIPVYILGDASWGSCDVNTRAADELGVDLLFNVAHTIAFENLGPKVVMINAFDDVTFDRVALECASGLRDKYSSISLLTTSQHLHQIEGVKDIFNQYGYTVIIGKGKGQLNDAQVFGCEFYPAYDSIDKVDAFIFLGQSLFHSVGVAASTGKPTYMLDPYFQQYTQVNDLAAKMQKKSVLAVYKALDCEKIGLIIGLKEGQFSKLKALELRDSFQREGKVVQLIALTDITDERLQNFKDIDLFVQIACPRISSDNSFSKLVISVPEATALLKLMRKESIQTDFLKIRHWL
ncbi:MAG TPA: 2-(3-amino-3-carboxypropyl)histidine synthase subunit 1/2 [Nitrososphaeraceae archaeon]|jgi:2-(3-amino-3-carboxypropyl)histidine synthase